MWRRGRKAKFVLNPFKKKERNQPKTLSFEEKKYIIREE